LVDYFTLLVIVGVLAGFIVKKRKSIWQPWKSEFPRTDRLTAFFKEQLVGLGNALLLYGVVYIVLYFGYQLVSQVMNPKIASPVAVDMLKSLIDLDGVLIGFVGVIGVYVFSETNRAIEKASVGDKILDEWRTNILWLFWLAVLSFAASVMFSLQSMSYIESNADILAASFLLPIDAMLLGMAGIGLIIYWFKAPSKKGSLF
jgi:hypothetical protein